MSGRSVERMRGEVESLRASIKSLDDAAFSLRNAHELAEAREVDKLRERIRRQLVDVQRELLVAYA